jgi:hypothetical protein
MAMDRTLATLAAAALLLAPLAAGAQGKDGLTYRCTGKDGKRYYGSTIPRQCLGERIPFGEAAGEEGPADFVAHRHDRLGGGAAIGDRLVADVHHAGSTGLIEV